MSGDEGIDDLAGEPGVPEVLTALAELAAETPPPAVRSAVVASITRRPRPEAVALPAPTVYERRRDEFAALLDELRPADWTATARPYQWTVHGLVAHVAVIEEYTARQFGLDREPPDAGDDPATGDHLAMGTADIEAMLSQGPEVAVTRWKVAAERVAAHVGSGRFDPEAPTPLHGWPFSANATLIARSFELWTHTDDIRRATQRPLTTPRAGELKTMSATSVGALPLLLPLETAAPPTPTRLVLTGPGGGTYDLWGPDHHRNLLVIDVVDYCRVVARRAEPQLVTTASEGDGELLAALLRAAQAIAM